MQNFKFFLLAILQLLLVTASSRAQDADSARILLERANQAYQNKDYRNSARDYVASLKFNPQYAVAAFNAACNYSLLNEKKEALKWLEQAVDWGFYDFEKDSDLENIRKTGQYKKLQASARKLAVELAQKTSQPVYGQPRDFDSTRTYGLLVALHGYGSDPNNIALALAGAPQRLGYIVVAPYGPRYLGHGGFGWGTWEQTEQKVLEAIKQAQAKYKIDPAKMILTGFSQGATHTYYVGTKNAAMFRGIIPISGRYNSEVDQFLPRSRENGLRIFVMFGGAEPEAMIKSNLDALRSFVMSGITASMSIYARLGHALPPNQDAELERAIKWVESK
jgi:predicted esterase